MRILIAEDDSKMGDLLRRGLTDERTQVGVVQTGPQLIDSALGAPCDVIILDVMLPGMDGFATCRRLRARGVWTPVLMLTARDAVTDRVEGLEAGADDYLVKPFALAELRARLNALTRRTGTHVDAKTLRAGDLVLDIAHLTVHRGETTIEMSPTEIRVLGLLLRNAGAVVTREAILDRAWDENYEARSNVVDVYVRHLRSKIDTPFGLKSIETVRGAGYRLRADGGRS
ncbi:MAG: two component transcriptional regulator, winged helix family [Thermoleophilia bacterium]|nr:two component transcriptional regulator, winged helix family [Thermoleophilia bacterium]